MLGEAPMSNTIHPSPDIHSFISSTHIQVRGHIYYKKNGMDFKIFVKRKPYLNFIFP